MDFINEINDMLMTSSSSEGEHDVEQVARLRRPYRMFDRNTVDKFDDVDFHKYFRITKNVFWRLHDMIRVDIDGDRRRFAHSSVFLQFKSFISISI